MWIGRVWSIPSLKKNITIRPGSDRGKYIVVFGLGIAVRPSSTEPSVTEEKIEKISCTCSTVHWRKYSCIMLSDVNKIINFTVTVRISVDWDN